MELSEYEAKRQRRIEQNRQQLEALNIRKVADFSRPNGRKKRQIEPLKPVRRSIRQRQQVDRNMMKSVETEAPMDLEMVPFRPQKEKKREFSLALDLPVTQPIDWQTLEMQMKNLKHLSSSELEIQLETVHSKWLGAQLLPTGKQTVMQGLCPSGYFVKFSKMSGVQAWKNAVVLFVNVEHDSGYENVFHDEEQVDGARVVYFQWFGQNRWHDESPLVQRLRRVKKGYERLRLNDSYYDQKDEETDEPLLLFLRHTQGPYIYCGRLGYLGYRPTSRPVEFRWQLLDSKSLDWERVQGLITCNETK